MNGDKIVGLSQKGIGIGHIFISLWEVELVRLGGKILR